MGRSVAVGSLCSEAREQLLLLRELVADDDVVALLLDQGGVDAVCSLAMELQASPSDEAEVVLQHALLVLQLVCVQEKCMVDVVSHGQGRTLFKMLKLVCRLGAASRLSEVPHLLTNTVPDLLDNCCRVWRCVTMPWYLRLLSS